MGRGRGCREGDIHAQDYVKPSGQKSRHSPCGQAHRGAMDFTSCPECGLPAEIVGQFQVYGVHGREDVCVLFDRVRCVTGHNLVREVAEVPDPAPRTRPW